MLAVYARVLLDFQWRRARRRGVRDGHTGCVTMIQRFGGGLNLNVHFHTLVFDGVFAEADGGALRFQPTPPPTDEEVGVVLATVYTRVQRLLRRRGFDPDDAGISAPDPVVEESPSLAGISSGCCRAPRGTRTSPASISMPTSPCRRRTVRVWSSSAATCCARRWPRIAYGSWAMAASGSP